MDLLYKLDDEHNVVVVHDTVAWGHWRIVRERTLSLCEDVG